MIIVIGQNNYQKHEYSLTDCLMDWLKRTNYPTSGQCVAFSFHEDVEFKDVDVDPFGTMTYPKSKLRWRYEVPLERMENLINQLELLDEQYDELDCLIYEKLRDDVDSLDEQCNKELTK